jgi:hypothetical protein
MPSRTPKSRGFRIVISFEEKIPVKRKVVCVAVYYRFSRRRGDMEALAISKIRAG